MSVTTGRSSIDASGDVFVYIPPNAGLVNRGASIVNGTYNQVTAGNQATLTGIVQFAAGSDRLQAIGGTTYQTVTIVAGPVLGTGAQPTPAPQTTGTIGISAAPAGFVYTPPNASQIPVGSQVTYGPVMTINDGELWPPTPIIMAVQGTAMGHANNLVLWRQVTVVPL